MSYWHAFIDFIYPPVCKACGRPLVTGERTLCTVCRVHLPYTGYERWADNPAAQAFYGRVPLQMASAMLFFAKDGRVQQLLHQLKYKRQSDLGLYLGGLMGQRLSRSGLCGPVDYIVPVPLHPDKQKKRGYNQAALLGEGMAHTWWTDGAVGKRPVLLSGLLRKRRENESQTRKNRADRWDNVQAAYGVSEAVAGQMRMAGKHILLVDDVLTTGATLESAAAALLAACPDMRLSVAVAATPA